ncbi:MAG: hypothetical protein SW833_12365 [Cyanobacteriota bacterium]|nr:hypothetical protein [Cyanobacteriota bacterium]
MLVLGISGASSVLKRKHRPSA